jgi:hypothetical protein
VLTLLGVCQIFSNKLPAAEENLKEALRQIEQLGMEMELTACELYNSIAQLMITKKRQWEAQRKGRVKREALDWLITVGFIAVSMRTDIDVVSVNVN